jgi:ankyrin repeat protein
MLASRDVSQFKLVDMMIQYGADINLTTQDGMTAMAMTILFNNKEITEFYIAKGANIFNEKLEQRNFSPFIIGISL